MHDPMIISQDDIPRGCHGFCEKGFTLVVSNGRLTALNADAIDQHHGYELHSVAMESFRRRFARCRQIRADPIRVQLDRPCLGSTGDTIINTAKAQQQCPKDVVVN